MMTEILCIGSALWDVIGRAPERMAPGADMPGRIIRAPGGVALNVAMGLAAFGLAPRLLSAVGADGEGCALLADAARRGIDTDLVHRGSDLRTDRYMAIESADGLVAAIADTSSLERAGAAILAPLLGGRLGTRETPFAGLAFLDGNLPGPLLAEVAAGPWLRSADLRIAPASPGKAGRVAPFLGLSRATIYLNRQEAASLLGADHGDAASAARALAASARARFVVTDGGRSAALAASSGEILTATPPRVPARRITGAGDRFVAAHIAAERAGLGDGEALSSGLAEAAGHVAREDSE